jgi:hypothetical protein
MILTLYRMICAYMVFMIVLHLFTGKELRDKVMLAFMLIPFVLRMLLVK